MAFLKDVAHRFKNGDFNISTLDESPEGQQSVSSQNQPSTQLAQWSSQGAEGETPRDTVQVGSGTQYGIESDQSVQSGTRFVESVKSVEYVESVESLDDTETLQKANNCVFEVTSPPRSRGRPKQSARSKKAARRRNVEKVQDDSSLYSDNLSLANVQEALKETLRVMKNWHKAMKSIQHVDKAVCWVDTIDDAMQMPTTFRDEPDANIVSKLKSILLISVQDTGGSTGTGGEVSIG
ncbi:hypothetical protein PI126_g1829 [Phytophthora idaei]|nr:hypothetical protein PI126_g1829 [Phytophthora idaei]